MRNAENPTDPGETPTGQTVARGPRAITPNPFADAGAAGLVERPADVAPLVAALARGERIGVVGRRGAGRRTLVDAALRRTDGLDLDVLRVDLARATSWLEVADALATRLHGADGADRALPAATRPKPRALRLYRTELVGDRVPLADVPHVRRLARTSAGAPLGNNWAIQLARPRQVGQAEWPMLAFGAVVEEIARRAVGGRGRYAVVLDGADALADAATAEEGAAFAAVLDRTLAGAPDGAAFALLACGAGPTAAVALGPLAPAVTSVRALPGVPPSDATAWLARGFAATGTPVDAAALERITDLAEGLPRYLRDLARACWDEWAGDVARGAAARAGEHAPARPAGRVAGRPVGEAGDDPRARDGGDPPASDPVVSVAVVERGADAHARRDAARHAATWAALPASQRVALLAIIGASGRRGARAQKRAQLASTATSRETGLPITTMQRAVAGLVAKGIVWREQGREDRVSGRPERTAPLRACDEGFARWLAGGRGRR